MSDIDWQGRMPRADLKPLTVEWFRAAMHPRHAVDGTVTYVLTPPRHASGALFRVLSWLAFIGAAIATATYPLWR